LLHLDEQNMMLRDAYGHCIPFQVTQDWGSRFGRQNPLSMEARFGNQRDQQHDSQATYAMGDESRERKPPFTEQMKEVLASANFRTTCTALCLCDFIQVVMKSLWQCTANDAWGLRLHSKGYSEMLEDGIGKGWQEMARDAVWEAPVVWLVISTIGGFVGTKVGQKWIEGQIGIREHLDVPSMGTEAKTSACLGILSRVSFCTAVMITVATVASAISALKFQKLVYWNVPQAVLVLMILSIGALISSVSAMQGVLITECKGLVGLSRAQGSFTRKEVSLAGDKVLMVAKNAVGYGGVMLTGSITDLVGYAVSKACTGDTAESFSCMQRSDPIVKEAGKDFVDAAKYTFGMSFVFLMTWALYFGLKRAAEKVDAHPALQQTKKTAGTPQELLVSYRHHSIVSPVFVSIGTRFDDRVTLLNDSGSSNGTAAAIASGFHGGIFQLTSEVVNGKPVWKHNQNGRDILIYLGKECRWYFAGNFFANSGDNFGDKHRYRSPPAFGGQLPHEVETWEAYSRDDGSWHVREGFTVVALR